MVWVWVRTVANGVAGAVANGSEPSRLGLGADRRREWFGAVVVNGSDRREWFKPPSRMVQTVVANGSDRRPSSRMVQTVVANGSDRRPSSRMVQTVANSYRRL